MTRRAGVAAVLGLLLAVMVPFVGAIGPAGAHATVRSTVPANDAELDVAPGEIVVTFSEPVTLTVGRDAATVIDDAGTRYDAGEPVLSADRSVLTIPLVDALPETSYIASWSVVSADAHPIGGSIQFGVGVPASVFAAPTPTEPDAGLTLAVGLLKGLLYLGLTVAFGILPTALLLGAQARERRRVVRVAWIGAAVVVLASLAGLVAQFLWVLSSGTPIPVAEWPTAFAAFAASAYGVAVAVRVAAVVAAVLVLIGVERAGRLRFTGFLALGVVAVATVVVNGHGGAGNPVLFVSTALHAVGAVAWLGGLAVLGWLLLRGRLDAERLRLLPRWSVFAGVVVAVITASGLLQGLAQVVYPAALVSTQYGLLLLGKLVLVLVALVFAVFGFRWTRRQVRSLPPDGRPAPGQTARLRRSVRWEAGAAVAVIALSGVLSSVTPAKDDYAPTASAASRAGPYAITLEVAPARLGPQTFRVVATRDAGLEPATSSVQVVLSQVDGPVAELAVALPYRIPGDIVDGQASTVTFASAAVAVPATGAWNATITVIESATVQYTTTIPYLVE